MAAESIALELVHAEIVESLVGMSVKEVPVPVATGLAEAVVVAASE